MFSQSKHKIQETYNKQKDNQNKVDGLKEIVNLPIDVIEKKSFQQFSIPVSFEITDAYNSNIKFIIVFIEFNDSSCFSFI